MFAQLRMGFRQTRILRSQVRKAPLWLAAHLSVYFVHAPVDNVWCLIVYNVWCMIIYSVWCLIVYNVWCLIVYNVGILSLIHISEPTRLA